MFRQIGFHCRLFSQSVAVDVITLSISWLPNPNYSLVSLVATFEHTHSFHSLLTAISKASATAAKGTTIAYSALDTFFESILGSQSILKGDQQQYR